MKKIYTAMNEAVFYYCIGSDLNKAKIFIQQVIKRKVYSIELKNTKLLKDYMYTKEKTLDYLVLTDIGYVNIEINNYNKEWRINRDITYVCKVLTNSISKENDYSNMKKVIQININRLGKTEVGCQMYTLSSQENKKGFENILTDILQIYVVNIDFYKNLVYNGNKKLIKDNYLLCALDLEPDDIDKISEGNEELMVFKKLLEEINDQEDFVNWISAEEESEKIQRTMINEAKTEGYNEGIEQGIEQGQKERNLEIAKNLLNQNVDKSIIALSTGLSIEEINKLK